MHSSAKEIPLLQTDSGVSSPTPNLIALPPAPQQPQIFNPMTTYLLQWDPTTGQPMAQPVFAPAGLVTLAAPAPEMVGLPPQGFTLLAPPPLPPQPKHVSTVIKREEGGGFISPPPTAELIDISGEDDDEEEKRISGEMRGDALMDIAMKEIVADEVAISKKKPRDH